MKRDWRMRKNGRILYQKGFGCEGWDGWDGWLGRGGFRVGGRGRERGGQGRGWEGQGQIMIMGRIGMGWVMLLFWWLVEIGIVGGGRGIGVGRQGRLDCLDRDHCWWL
jgi:hypothetical protein